MDFKIEKGLPIEKWNRESKYPFREMEVGDSFVAPESLRFKASQYGKNLGMKFSTRKLPDGTVRIWRIA